MINKYEWDFTDIYKGKEEYKKDIELIEQKLEEISKYKGSLAESSESIYNCYNNYEEIVEINNKIYAYAMLKHNKNMADQEGIILFREAQALDNKVDAKTAFILPELTEIDEGILKKYMNEDKRLERY